MICLTSVMQGNMCFQWFKFSFTTQLQELEIAIEDERRSGDEARQAVTVLERKRIALQTELEDVRALLETVSNLFVFFPFVPVSLSASGLAAKPFSVTQGMDCVT